MMVMRGPMLTSGSNADVRTEDVRSSDRSSSRSKTALSSRSRDANEQGKRSNSGAIPASSSGAWSWASLRHRLGSDALLAAALVVFATGLLAYLPSAFGVDSWLALMAGRDIWQHGLPHHESLTILSHGVAWVDQQWLSQLLTYGLYLIGGLGLVGVANMALIVGAAGVAVVTARRLGAHAITVMLILPACAWLIIPSREIRTQEFMFPLFAAIVYLLARDSRNPSRRVYWCVPLLVVWANLHGTASIGAGLVVLRGLTLAWERRNVLTHGSQWRRPLILAVAAPLCLLLTPYALHTVSYYHATLLNSSLKSSVTEWQPVTSEWAVAWPFFALAGVAVWSFGRPETKTTAWEKLALVALAAVSISVIRNTAFFALAALALLPPSLDGAIPPRLKSGVRIRPRLNLLAGGAAVICLVVATTSALVQRPAKYELAYQRTGLLDAVRAATKADPSIRVLADVRFADWLLWRDPALAGRMSNDIRYELMTGQQIDELRDVFAVLGTKWKRAANGYRLVVLDRSASPEAVRGFRSESGSRVLYDDGTRLVILRSAQAAGA